MAGTELAKAYVQIIPSADGIKGRLTEELGGEAESAGNSAGLNIAGAIKGAIAAAGIGALIKSTLSEGSALQQSIGGIETLYKESSDTMIKYANEAYKTAGMSADDYMQTSTSFAAALLKGVGGDTAKAAEAANTAIIDMSDNANKMGTSMDSIQMAYQGFAKGNYNMLDNLKLGYGGTKTEMERLLSDAQKLTGVKYDLNNLSDVYSAIHVIQDELGVTGTTAREGATTFEGSMSAMKAAAQNLMGSIALGEDIGPKLQALTESVFTFVFDNLMPMLGNILSAVPGLVAGIAEGIVAGIPKILSVITNLVTEIANTLINYDWQGSAINFVTSLNSGISTNLPQLLQSGVEIITNLVSGLVSALPNIISGAGIIISGLITAIATALPMLLQAGVDLILGILSGFESGKENIALSMMDAIGNIISTVMDALPGLITAGIQIITNFITGMMSLKGEAVQNTAEIVSSLVQKIAEGIPGFLDKGIEILNALIDGIGQALPQIIKAAIQVIQQMAESLISTLPIIIKAGVDIITSLINGIAQNLPGLVAKATEIMMEIIKTLVSNLPGILATGVQLIGALLSGIVQAIPQILSAVANLALSIIKAIMVLPAQLMQAGGQMISSLVSGIAGKVSSVISEITKLGSEIINKAKSINLTEVGKNLIDGMVNGIKGAAGKVADAVKNAAKNAFDAVKGFFGIHSPSRLMRDEIGKYIPAGIAEGINGNAKSITFDKVNARIMQEAHSTQLTMDSIEPASNNGESLDILGNITEALSKFYIVMDGKKVGKIASPEVNRTLGTTSSLELRGAV
nr:MAG TPA: tail tape measure protein [Caudoviricetes sp.]